VPEELAAETVAMKVPFSVGVPVITPVAVSMLNPFGNPVAEKRFGLLSAVTWKLRGFPLMATISGLLVMTGTGAMEKEAWSVAPCNPATLA